MTWHSMLKRCQAVGQAVCQRRSTLAWLAGVVVVGLIAAGFLFGDAYILTVFDRALLLVLLALGLNIIAGYGGLLDLGYIAFFAVGAYSVAILGIAWPGHPFLGMVLGCALSVGAGIAFGIPTVRASGDYLALVTLAFGEIVRLVLLNATGVTGGPQGLRVEPVSVFGRALESPKWFMVVFFVAVVLAVLFSLRLRETRIGKLLFAIRDDEGAAMALGVRVPMVKLFAFGVGAAIAGLAGGLFALWQLFVSPVSFVLMQSILVLSIVVLGGMGNVFGVVCVGLGLGVLPEVLRGLDTYRDLSYGAILILAVMGRHLWARVAARQNRRSERQSGDERKVRTSGVASACTSTAHDVTILSRPAPGQGTDVSLGVEHLAKRFGGNEVLIDVSFRIQPHETIGLIGPNGAGKSTVLGCLAGVVRADSGKALLQPTAFDLLRANAASCATHGVARTFQRPRLFNSFGVFDNVLMGVLEPRNVRLARDLFVSIERRTDLAQARSAAAAACEVCGLRPFLDCPVNALPLMAVRRVELARAIVRRPLIMLLDEPTAGLSASEKEEFCDLVSAVSERVGASVLFVEHDMNVVSRLADRVLALVGGRIVADGSMSEIRSCPVVVEAYLGDGFTSAGTT